MSAPKQPRGYTTKAVERFWSKVSKDGDCWEWSATMFPNGYGLFAMDYKSRLAHRVSYELSIGPIPQGLVIDHLCHNKACVRPSHLEAVTHSENTARWHRHSASTTCRRGHALDEENTYVQTRANGAVNHVCRKCRRAHRKVWEAKRKERP